VRIQIPWYIQLWEAFLVGVTLLFLSYGLSSPLEWLGSSAVFVAFLHLQVQEEARCFAPARTTFKFFALLALREVLWVTYFYLAGTYAAIVGALFFAAFPAWRQILYRTLIRPKKLKCDPEDS